MFGLLFACGAGLVQPLCGSLFMKTVFAMYMQEDTTYFLLGLLLVALSMFLFRTLGYGCFMWVASNMTYSLRGDLY